MTLTERSSIPKDLRRSLVSASTSRGDSSEAARAETSGTYLGTYQQMGLNDKRNKTHWSFRSLSSSCNLKEIPRTGPFWIRFIKWVVTVIWSVFANVFFRLHILTTSDLVPQPLRGNSGDLIKDSLVGAAESVSHMYFIHSDFVVSKPLHTTSHQTPIKWVLLGCSKSLCGQCFLLSFPCFCALHMSLCLLSEIFSRLLLNPTSRSHFDPSNVQKAVYSLEVEGETGVVSLDEDSRRSLDGLCPDSTLLMRTDCELRENNVEGEDRLIGGRTVSCMRWVMAYAYSP